MELKKIFIITLVLLAIVSGYVIVDKAFIIMNQNFMEVFNDGYKIGLEDTVKEIFKQTDNCGVTSIWIENQTRQVVDVECVDNVNNP